MEDNSNSNYSPFIQALITQGSDGWQGGQACLPAAQLALEDVNKHPDLLRGYNLNLAAKDDMVGLGTSFGIFLRCLQVFFELRAIKENFF